MVTGGAGFIGSNLHAALVARGHETVVVDRLRANGKWRNLAKHPPSRLLPPDELEDFLAGRPPLEMLFHLGAISDTTASDGDAAWAVNVELPLRLWGWCAARKVRFVYASSASTYGDGTLGFDDDGSVGYLERLRPLNLYGWTKHAFDLRVARMLAAGQPRPPQWAGLKFFNVLRAERVPQGRDGLGGEGQARRGRRRPGAAAVPLRPAGDRPTGSSSATSSGSDDVVDVMLWLLDTPAASGLFNVGTGRARSYRDLANAVCDAAGVAGAGRVHRHARGAARPVPVLHRGRVSAACAPPATPASSRRWRRACGATCRTT